MDKLPFCELAQMVLRYYQVRKSRRQKAEFRVFLKKWCDACGLSYHEEWRKNSCNVSVGDVEKAKVLFTAHYDTCAVSPFLNFAAPRNWPLQIACTFCCVLFPSAGVCAVLYWMNVPYRLLAIVFLTILTATIALALEGPANRHTANDNTSGVLLLLWLMQELPNAIRQHAALVFFDNEEKGRLGSSAFKKMHPNPRKEGFLINFDCVGDGDHFLFIGAKGAREHPYYPMWQAAVRSAAQACGKTTHFHKAATTQYSSDQRGFSKGIGVAAMHYTKGIGLWLGRIHTPLDTILQEKNIDCLTQAAATFCNQLSEYPACEAR